MTSYTGTLVSSTDHGHSSTSSLVATGVLAVGLICLLGFSELLPEPPQAGMALPPVQAAIAILGDTSLPDAAKVFDGREVAFEESAPTI